MMPKFTNEDVIRIDRIHEDVKRFLMREHPRAPIVAIIVALSYEIGRLTGQLTDHMSDAEIDAMIDGVNDIMRQHVHAFRRGMRE